MAIQASIPLGVQPIQVPDPLNRMAQVMQIQGAQNQNAMAQYSLAKAQRQDQQINALMGALGNGLDLSTPEGQSKAFAIAPEAAGPLMKNLMDARQSQSTIRKNEAQAGNFDSEVAARTTQQYRDQLANVTTPQQAVQWLRAQAADPVLGKIMNGQAVEAAIASIPSDPQGFQQWRNQAALGMTKFIELNKPQTTVVNAGGTSQIVQTPGLGGAPTLVGSVQHTVSPDAALSASTSRANNAANIAKDYAIAGMSPDGTANANVEQMAQAIANGQIPPLSGFALARPQGQTVMRRVMEINPTYDATTYGAKAKAAKDFTSGQQGNALRSVATANAHLDQLNTLVDALNNNNLQVANKVGNWFATQTGNPQATNFDAIKNIVGQEVVKAIVAGGGSAGERDEAANAFSTAKSPAQLKGAIEHYRMVMGAQQTNLLEQRRAAGLTDATLPDYGAGASQASPGIPSAADIDAELRRRGGR